MKAFPQKYPEDASSPHHFLRNPVDTGMDLRDYFAAKAMQGFQEQWVYDNSDEIASQAYTLADAMLKAREK
jgi:hypothetical protein